MNLDELERLYLEAKETQSAEAISALVVARRDTFPALLALARDGERYRWAKDNLFIGYVFQDDVSSMSDLDIDASINAMKEST